MRFIRSVETLVALLAVLVLSTCIEAQYLYLDVVGTNDIYRYDASLNPAPAPGQSGAMFADFSGTDKYKSMAAGSDGYLYFVSYNDIEGGIWPVPGNSYVQRIDVATGVLDSTWNVEVAGATRLQTLRFAPDGKLYAADYTTFGNAYLVDIATKTASAKFGIYQGPLVCDVAFDDQGRAYGSSYAERAVYRWNESGGSFSPDAYDGDPFWGVSIPSGNPWGLVWKDGYLYVGNYANKIYRFNTTTDILDPNWEVTLPGGSAGFMAFGPDGKLYVADWDKVARVDVTAKTAEEIPDLAGVYRWNLTWGAVPVLEPARIGGHVSLEDVSAGFEPAMVGVQIQIDQPDGTRPVKTVKTLLDTNGNYLIDVLPGTYNVTIKAVGWLPEVVPNVVVPVGVTATVNVSLKNGDVNGDSDLTIDDVDLLQANIDQVGVQ